MEIRNGILAVLFFFIGIILTKAILWDILDWFRTTFMTGTTSSMFLIIQWLVAFTIIFIIPVAIARGTTNE